MQKDVYSRLYDRGTFSATRKHTSDKPKRSRSTRTCPLPDSPLGSNPQVSLEGDLNDPHTLLRAVFQFYCRFGRTGAHGTSETTMDNANFAKFCRECPQLVGDNFSPVDIDLTFVKVKAKGERRISYVMFLEALGIIATKKYPDKSLAVALPLLLEMNVSTLSCLETALSPGRTSWRRKSSLTDGHSTKATKLEREGALPDNQLIELAVHPPPVPIVSHMT
ncbi:hypothetical protein Ae201684_010621 [Aphanomyces euteiches]|uniref:Uncharacterized protein n=1 Tax=Aphanomyces euteiches TaxID=100861 RepID=A0A6G0WXR9_9STRA|nr:hypothetical protein Ae201684_010621 [Aphanomyces euteiches]KAH9141117.1 hypothetical protein AeRB84_014689 [Aphanomyces euteiches]